MHSLKNNLGLFNIKKTPPEGGFFFSVSMIAGNVLLLSFICEDPWCILAIEDHYEML